jgi:hypothetical protein
MRRRGRGKAGWQGQIPPSLCQDRRAQNPIDMYRFSHSQELPCLTCKPDRCLASTLYAAHQHDQAVCKTKFSLCTHKLQLEDRPNEVGIAQLSHDKAQHRQSSGERKRITALSSARLLCGFDIAHEPASPAPSVGIIVDLHAATCVLALAIRHTKPDCTVLGFC